MEGDAEHENNAHSENAQQAEVLEDGTTQTIVPEEAKEADEAIARKLASYPTNEISSNNTGTGSNNSAEERKSITDACPLPAPIQQADDAIARKLAATTHAAAGGNTTNNGEFQDTTGYPMFSPCIHRADNDMARKLALPSNQQALRGALVGSSANKPVGVGAHHFHPQQQDTITATNAADPNPNLEKAQADNDMARKLALPSNQQALRRALGSSSSCATNNNGVGAHHVHPPQDAIIETDAAEPNPDNIAAAATGEQNHGNTIAAAENDQNQTLPVDLTTRLRRQQQHHRRRSRQQRPGAFPHGDRDSFVLSATNALRSLVLGDAGSSQLFATPEEEQGNRNAANTNHNANDEEELHRAIHDGDGPLAEAVAIGASQNFVFGMDTDDLEVTPIDVNELERRRNQRNRRKRLLSLGIVCGMILTMVVVATALTIGLALVPNQESIEENSEPTMHNRSTIFPSAAPSELPSLAPTEGALEFLRQADNLPSSTLENLEIFGTPQQKAGEWLIQHPKLAEFPDWRKSQLFALATLFHALQGTRWTEAIKSRWMDYDKEECLWHSSLFGSFFGDQYFENPEPTTLPCSTSGGEFQVLSLAYMLIPIGPQEEEEEEQTLLPSIPPEIALLTALRTIQLPALIGTSSSGIHAHNYSLGYFLPSELFELKNLTTLTLGGNGLSGPIPTEFGLLSTSFLELSIDRNRLSGLLPSQFGLLTNLRVLDAGTNSLQGSVPSQLGGGATNLARLHLDENQLSAVLPTQLGRLTEMTSLFLGTNNLTGPIASEIAALTKITELELQDNSFSGNLPSEILGRLVRLTSLSVQNNLLSGTLPTQLGLLGENLQLLQLQNNTLSGAIPTQVGLLGNLQVLQLQNNRFSGPIPSQLGKMTSLFGARFDDNTLSGELPQDYIANILWSTTSTQSGLLSTLTLEGNRKLFGRISEEMCSMGMFGMDPFAPTNALSFDCNPPANNNGSSADSEHPLCGCCWCNCSGDGFNLTACPMPETFPPFPF